MEMGGAGAGDASFDSRRLRSRPLGHVAAVRPAANGQLVGIGDAARNEIIDARHNVPVIAAAPIAPIYLNKLLAVTARSSNIRIKNGVTACRKELSPGFDGVLPCARRPAMNQGDERQLGFAVRARWFQERGFDFLAVEGFVFIELWCAERVLLPGIIYLRDLLRSALLVPTP